MSIRTLTTFAKMTLALLGIGAFAPPAVALELRDRWVYVSNNLWVDKNVDNLDALMRRAAKANYTGILLNDSKFGKLSDMDARYFRNVDRIKKLAAELKLEIIPTLFPIGYSDAILWHDPNLVEALPVRDALFVVTNGVARIKADPPILLKGGDFTDFKLWGWRDPTVVPDGGAIRVDDPKGENARISQKIKVAPFRQYHVSVRVKTQDFLGKPEVKVLAGNRSLNHADLGVKATQDWTVHHAVFNSLEFSEVNLYLGVWGGTSGTLWWDDATIEEAGLLNLVRRDGAPLTVKLDGGRTLGEGADFERTTDPNMGNKPWRGSFEVWHEPPVIKTALPDGTRLRVSYCHAVMVMGGQVMICPSEPRTVELLRDQAQRMHAAWGTRGYMMSHDEIRVLNWCDACQKRNLDAGAILADNVRTCIKILREVNPGGRIYVWTDMFDPNHNAHNDYYLVRGDLAGSWEGLDKDVTMVPWYFGKRDASLKWFADRGHQQVIAGYYDSNPEKVRDWLNSAKKVNGVVGVMYTTWRNNYNDLEKFSEVISSFK